MGPHQRRSCVLAKASAQFGLIHGDQARACGLSSDTIQRIVRKGEWKRVAPRVYRIFVAGSEWQRDVAAVGLWLGDAGALSHRGAAAWWRLDGFEAPVIEFSMKKRRAAPMDRVILHATPELGSTDRGLTNGIWVTSPTRTLLDVAAVSSFDRLEVAAHCAIRRNLTSVYRLERRLSAAAVRGRSGIGRMRRLLLDLGTNGGPTGSQLETRFMQLLRRERLPTPVRQFEIFDRDGMIGRGGFRVPGTEDRDRDTELRVPLATSDVGQGPAKVGPTVRQWMATAVGNE